MSDDTREQPTLSDQTKANSEKARRETIEDAKAGGPPAGDVDVMGRELKGSIAEREEQGRAAVVERDKLVQEAVAASNRARAEELAPQPVSVAYPVVAPLPAGDGEPIEPPKGVAKVAAAPVPAGIATAKPGK